MAAACPAPAVSLKLPQNPGVMIWVSESVRLKASLMFVFSGADTQAGQPRLALWPFLPDLPLDLDLTVSFLLYSSLLD